METIHLLKVPLYIGGEEYPSPYVIPAGTRLYYDGSLAEGVSRYRIYVNVKSDLLLSRNEDGAIDPISAEPMSKDDVLHFMRGVRLSVADIKSLISEGGYSAEDRREIERHLKEVQAQARE